MMRHLKTAVFAMSIFGGGVTAGRAQDTATLSEGPRIEAAKQLLAASGAVDAMIASVRAAIPAQREATPNLPEEFWTRFDSKVVADAPILLDSIAVLYAKTFTLKELNDATAFYKSPLGQRMRAAQPALITESTQIGQRWGSRIGMEIGTSLAEE